LPNYKGFRPYEFGYVRCTPCGLWIRRESVSALDAQGSPLCPRCGSRIRLGARRTFKVVTQKGKKLRCRAPEHRRLEERGREVYQSWLCVLYEDDVFCPHSEIPRDDRMSSVCMSCNHLKELEREMEKDEEEEDARAEAILRDPDAWVRGEI
jgi:hypothetical protein